MISTPQKSLRARNCAIRFSALALGWAMAGPSLASTPSATMVPPLLVASAPTLFNIPSGGLATALQTFARQAGIPVSFDSKKIEGLTTAGLNGSYEIQAGLDVLLQGTGYVSNRNGDGYTLVPAPPAAAMLAPAR